MAHLGSSGGFHICREGVGEALAHLAYICGRDERISREHEAVAAFDRLRNLGRRGECGRLAGNLAGLVVERRCVRGSVAVFLPDDDLTHVHVNPQAPGRPGGENDRCVKR